MPNAVKEYGQTSEFVNMFSQGEIAAGPIMEMYFGDLRELFLKLSSFHLKKAVTQ